MDVDGRPFHAYTPEYRLQRIEAGYSSTPDLVRTGHMMGAAIVRKTAPNEVACEIVDRQQSVKAPSHNFGSRRGMPQREFFGVRQDKELEALADTRRDGIIKRIEQKIKK